MACLYNTKRTKKLLVTQARTQIFKALYELLDGLSDAQIQNIASVSGIRIPKVHPAYISPNTDAKHWTLSQVRIAFDRENQRSDGAAVSVLRDMARALREQVGEEALQEVLRRGGFNFIDDKFLQLDVLDIRLLHSIPAFCHDDLKTAGFRISNRDYTGAITSACGAVDTLTNTVIERDGISIRKHGEASFASKVNTVLFKHLKVHDEMRKNLIAEGKSPAEAGDSANRIRGEINQAAQRLQELRPRKADVHGRKSANEDTARETMALSLQICQRFNGKV